MAALRPAGHVPRHGPWSGRVPPVWRRTSALGLLIALQGASAAFFLGDVVEDLLQTGLDSHTGYETLATLALLLGVVFGALEMRRTLERSRRSEAALKMAAGAFAELVEERFDAWKLTPAEAEVALLTLKGFEGKEIAELRGVAAGTVRAQLARIYAKSGSAGRGQFVSLFIDDLLDRPLAAGPELPASA